MTKSPEQSKFSKPETEERKFTPEQFESLEKTLQLFVELEGAVQDVKTVLGWVRGESYTGDDHPEKHDVLRTRLRQLNEKLKEIPDSIEL